MKPNKHEWRDSIFIGDVCRICDGYGSILTGTGKAEHARKHVREGKAERIGEGTKENPYRYVKTGGRGSNAPGELPGAKKQDA
jgi:hypothetical protein